MSHLAHHDSSRSHQEAIEYLGSAIPCEAGTGPIERIETHGAIVFLAGEHAYKIKKDVRFPYMDFSTLDLRRRACEREIELNRPHAPDIYLGVVAIMRSPDGALHIGGGGEPIEWVVHMRRFPSDGMLSAVVERGAFGPELARETADAVVDYHRGSPIVRSGAAVGGLGRILCEVVEGLRSAGSCFDPAEVTELEAGCGRHLDRIRALLERRERAGLVRRCHGDLHLGNIVLWRGRPTLFDAIEFDEEMATIDVLYDLAFLLMDLDARDQRAAANAVLNRYLWRSQEVLDLEGLAALPLFLGLRAAIRGMVHAQRVGQNSPGLGDALLARSSRYLTSALAYLKPAEPRLVAVGGLSGSGKSTLAAALAPLIGPAPGAVHLRSDLERKAMLGVGETARLPAESYSSEVGRRVYERMLCKARAGLAAGQSVVVDAVFLRPDERRDCESVARSLSVPFQGLWLTAPIETMIERVDARTCDASDATADVVRRQIAQETDKIEWGPLDGSQTPEAVRSAACRLLAIS